MTVQLRSLRIAADFDGSKYVAGLEQKNAAERSSAQVTAQVGKAVEDLKIKVSSTVPIIEKISRQYIDGYGSAQKFNSELLRLARTQDANASSVTQLEQIYAGLQRRFGLVADAQELSKRGYLGLAEAIANVNGQLSTQANAPAASALTARMEQLRNAFDPAYVSAQKLTVELGELAEAERFGITITGGYESAMNRLILKHDSVAAAAHRQAQEYTALAAAGREASQADRFQSDINRQLGVGASGNLQAADSARFFAQELDRQEEIARLKAQQIGATFSSELNQRLGVNGFGTSARASAAAFEEAAREADEFSKKAAALRAQIDPVAAAQARLNGELAEYAVLAQRAELSVEELAKAQMMARSRFNAARSGLNDSRREHAANLNGLNVASAGFQLQDIAVTAAMGMNPATIGLQQGLQLSSAIGSMERPVAGLLAAFGSLVSSTTLITVGFVAASAAAIQYFMGANEETSKAEEALKNHSDLIRRIREAWPDAVAGLKEYSAESQKILRQDIQDSVALYKQAVADAAGDARAPLLSIPASDFNGATKIISDVQAAIASLDTSIAAETPDLRSFIERLIEIENQSGTPENIQEIIKQIRAAAASGLDAQGKLDPLIKTIEGVGAVAASEAKNIAAFVKAVDQLSQISPSRMTDLEQATKAYDEALHLARTEADVTLAEDQFSAAKKRISDQNPTIDDSDGRTLVIPAPGQKPSQLSDEPAKNAQKTADAYRDLIKSGNDRIDQMKLEGQTASMTGVAAQAFRFELDLMQKAQEKGRTVTPEQIKDIKALADAFREAAENAAQLKLSADLKFQQQQLFRSQVDQQIAQSQRGAGLPVDLNSEYANAVRQLEQLKELRAGIGGFFSDFRDGLMQGDSIGEAFGNAILNAMNNVLTKLTDSLINDLVNSLTSTSGSGGSILGSLFSAFKPANDNLAAAAGSSISTSIAAANDNAVRSAAGSALSFVGNYKSGVDAKLTDILNTAAQRFPGFKVDAMSGFRAGDPRFHGQGLATDVQLTDLASGRMLGNYQDATSFGTYEKFAQTARSVQMEKYPELAGDFRWGGYFGGGRGKYGAVDTMHFDLGGKHVGMGGGTWEGGLNSTQRALWPGADSEGMGSASAALDKLASNSQAATTSISGLTGAGGEAAKGLNSLGNSFGSFGQKLSGFQMGGGGGFNWGSLFSSSWAPNTTLGSFLGLSGGGYTGPGGINEPAGIVHRGEIVWSQADIARAGGIGAVEGMRQGWRGYSDGGLVGAPRRSTIADVANDRGISGADNRAVNISVNSGDVVIQGDVSDKNLKAIQDAIRENNRTLPDRLVDWERNRHKRAPRR